jgi:small subunit ribosomal protein S15
MNPRNIVPPAIEKGKEKEQNKGNAGAMSRIDKDTIQKQFQRHDADTGSSDVQIALLSRRIELLTKHLSRHKKDHSSRYGLIKMVNARRRLLDYLKKKDNARYKKLLGELSIRR